MPTKFAFCHNKNDFSHNKNDFSRNKNDFCYNKSDFCYNKIVFSHNKIVFCHSKFAFCHNKNVFININWISSTKMLAKITFLSQRQESTKSNFPALLEGNCLKILYVDHESFRIYQFCGRMIS